jgi:hypothetical protein
MRKSCKKSKLSRKKNIKAKKRTYKKRKKFLLRGGTHTIFENKTDKVARVAWGPGPLSQDDAGGNSRVELAELNIQDIDPKKDSRNDPIHSPQFLQPAPNGGPGARPRNTLYIQLFNSRGSTQPITEPLIFQIPDTAATDAEGEQIIRIYENKGRLRGNNQNDAGTIMERFLNIKYVMPDGEEQPLVHTVGTHRTSSGLADAGDVIPVPQSNETGNLGSNYLKRSEIYGKGWKATRPPNQRRADLEGIQIASARAARGLGNKLGDGSEDPMDVDPLAQRPSAAAKEAEKEIKRMLPGISAQMRALSLQPQSSTRSRKREEELANSSKKPKGSGGRRTRKRTKKRS